MSEKPNIIVIVLDAVRASNISSYGHQRKTTPNIDSLAEKGVRFKRATTVSPWTLPSHASLFTGVPPSIHGTNSINSSLPNSLTTIASSLSEQNYDTIGVSSNPWFSSLFGITRGFDKFYNLQGPFKTDTYRQFTKLITDKSKSLTTRFFELVDEQPFNQLSRNLLTAFYRKFTPREDKGAKQAIRKSIESINNSTRYFLFLHLLEPHLPYDPPSEYTKMFLTQNEISTDLSKLPQDAKEYNVGNVEVNNKEFNILEKLYDAEIRYADEQIGKLLNFVGSTKNRDNTFIIILSDHGENIGNHGLLGHNYSIHQSVLEIPLVMYLPEVFDSGRVVDERVTTLDIPATITDLLADYNLIDSKFNDQQYGQSLRTPVSKNREVYAEYLNPMPPVDRLQEVAKNSNFDATIYDKTMKSILRDNWKYIRYSDGVEEMYNLQMDPHENQDLLNQFPDLKDELSSSLDSWEKDKISLDNNKINSNISDNVKNRLDYLGYR